MTKRLALLLLFPAFLYADCDINQALQDLTPGAQWNLRSASYSGIEWLDLAQQKPTAAEISSSISTCQQTVISQRQQIQNDIFNVQLSTNTQAQKVAALIDLLKLKGVFK